MSQIQFQNELTTLLAYNNRTLDEIWKELREVSLMMEKLIERMNEIYRMK